MNRAHKWTNKNQQTRYQPYSPLTKQTLHKTPNGPQWHKTNSQYPPKLYKTKTKAENKTRRYENKITKKQNRQYRRDLTDTNTPADTPNMDTTGLKPPTTFQIFTGLTSITIAAIFLILLWTT